jgi:sulfite dehydrogenase (cytochrome) subunit B
MTHIILLCGLGGAAWTIALAFAQTPFAYDPPIEIATLKPGPGADVANVHCRTCHSADYISTQPRGPGFGKEFWGAEVTKMIKAYGAPITEAEAKIIVDYLSAAYGPKP